MLGFCVKFWFGKKKMFPQFQNVGVSQYRVISTGGCRVFVGLRHSYLQTLKVRHTPAPLSWQFLMPHIFPSWNPPLGLAQPFVVRDGSKKPQRAGLPWSGVSHSSTLPPFFSAWGISWERGRLSELSTCSSPERSNHPCHSCLRWGPGKCMATVILGYLSTVTSGRERLWEPADIHTFGLRDNSTCYCKWEKKGNSDIQKLKLKKTTVLKIPGETQSSAKCEGTAQGYSLVSGPPSGQFPERTMVREHPSLQQLSHGSPIKVCKWKMSRKQAGTDVYYHESCLQKIPDLSLVYECFIYL